MVLIIFFGIYAFDNPEKDIECYVSDELGYKRAYHSNKFLGDNYIDVGKQYNSVFIFGFVISLINLL